ncbi:MAG: 30S ribosomal protein S1 [Thermodesulfobacteriota bacterium]|nr:30S ribosomal protein S1 [Thermodesulfobacteriota bacterium]
MEEKINNKTINDEESNPENKEDDAFSSFNSEEDDKEIEMEQFYESSLSKLQEGELVKGTVVQVTKDYIMIDVGYKSEGQVSIGEFKDENGELTIAVGDEVEVLLERRENEDGIVVLSKDKADNLKVWNEISRTYNEDDVIEGKIISRIKGGLAVDIGVRAFLPGSQVDIRPVRNLDDLIGNTFKFKILKFNKKQRNIVLSRRAIFEKEREELREETLKILEEGQIVEGLVKNITDYGVFVDLGGVDGLLHITDLSWGRVKHPHDICSIGDRIKVKVIKYDKESQRVSLGLKQITDDPWSKAEENYTIGSRVTGKVVSLTDYGAFIRLEEGIEGLIHISEMSWTQKIRHPSKIVSLDDVVQAVVLDIDTSKKRISLGLKQVEPNPWDIVKEKYPIGTRIEGTIKNVMDFGLFIGIEEGIDGLIHVSDISWKQKIKNPSELYQKGQHIEAVVLNIDQENERFSLGIKQLEADPWDTISKRYIVGQTVSGNVTNVTDFGIFVELEEGIEGLVHVSEIRKEKVESPDAFAKVGDRVTALIINMSEKERKIGLSIKQLDETSEKVTIQKILNNQSNATSNLGELIKEELEQKAERET